MAKIELDIKVILEQLGINADVHKVLGTKPAVKN